jgi:hypothetical protein
MKYESPITCHSKDIASVKDFEKRAKLQGQGHKVKNLLPIERSCHRKHTYEIPITYYSKYMANVKVFADRQTNRRRGQKLYALDLSIRGHKKTRHHVQSTTQHNTIKLTGVGHTGFSNFVRNSRSLATACFKRKHGTDLPLTLNIFYINIVIFTMSSFLSKYMYTVVQSSLNIFLHLLFTMTTACHMYLYVEKSSKARNSKEKNTKTEITDNLIY